MEGASVFYVDSNGNMLRDSPIAITDKYGDFNLPTTNNGRSFTNEPFKITGGKTALTGQPITYWYAPAGTITMTPVTNLLFYCKEGALNNSKITTSLGIDSTIDFYNFDYYKVLISSIEKTSSTYRDALKSKNLGDAINVFATIGSYFLYGINGTNLDIEYDAMMRSIANISTGVAHADAHDDNGATHTHEEVSNNNEFAELFGTDIELCIAMIADRIRNKITNSNLNNAIDTNINKTYAELFAKALAQQMAKIITAIMGSTDIDNTRNYEIIGYAVVPYVYQVIDELKSNIEMENSNKPMLLDYFSQKAESIFKTATDNYFNVTTNHAVIARRKLVKSWENFYESTVVNNATVPFEPVNGSISIKGTNGVVVFK